MIDIHCHILPGLDDGAQNMEESVEMARIASKDGISKIVATPHLFRNHFQYDDLSLIEDKQKELNAALRSHGVAVDILTGAEVHISHNLIGEIRKNRSRFVLHQSSYMFVEFPSGHVFSGVKELFFDLMSEGIIPIIAHPERNSVFIQNPGLLYELVRMGGLTQVNSGSLSGLYGHRVEEAVFRFLKWNLVHFIGSDGHNTRSKAPRLSTAARKAAAAVGKEKAMALVFGNPRAVLEDVELPFLPDPADPSEKERKLRIKIPGIFSKRK